jgi:acyl-CoA hydrolase
MPPAVESAESDERPVSRSRTTMAEMMIPAYANFGGKIHGGILLGLMDKVAYACASKHAGRYCVTVNIDGVDFLAPVEVGDLVSLRASVNYVGRTSLMVGIHVDAENVTTGDVRHTNTSYFTMVAKDESGRPAVVPRLVLETRDDVRRFVEALARRELRRRYVEELDNARTNLTLTAEVGRLADERCRIAPELMSELK